MLKLTYHGSRDEIHVGDRVILRRFLRRPVAGVVCYLPGDCAPHPQFEIDGLSYWAISLENGSVISWPYAPGKLQASKRVTLVGQGDAKSAAISPEEELS